MAPEFALLLETPAADRTGPVVQLVGRGPAEGRPPPPRPKGNRCKWP